MKKSFLVFLTLILTGTSFGQAFFDVTKDFSCGLCGNNANPTANVDSLATYDMPKIKSVFGKIARESDIEFGYPQGGCQQRAQIMSMLLSKEHKIEHFRVWLFAPVNLDLNSNKTLEIKDKNNFDVTGTIKWNYHVAPVVRVAAGNKVKLFVIDPSINSNEPMLLADWFKSIGNSDLGKYTFLASERYFFNTHDKLSVINGSFYTFEGFAKNNLTLEMGLALDDVAMTVYRKHIVPIINSSNPADKSKVQTLKTVFGNSSTIFDVISKNSSGNNGNFSNTTNRDLLTKYPEIMIEARKLFQERTVFRANKTNKLLQSNTN